MNKVLIVEDEDIIRKGLIFMIDWLRAGCVVVGEAADGEEGLAMIKELRPDIVVTDVKMPLKDGLQMLEESIEEYGYEAIIISGYSEFEYAQKAIRLNVTEYLLKPIDFEQFYQTLDKLAVKLETKQKVRDYLRTMDEIGTVSILDARIMYNCRNEYVKKLLDHIRTCYPERISLNELSAAYGFSNTYLNAKFKQETNYTFNDFLNRYRVLQAVKLLKQDKLKVYEIAEAVGFQDYKYFNQVFKKYAGCAPGKFITMMGDEQTTEKTHADE